MVGSGEDPGNDGEHFLYSPLGLVTVATVVGVAVSVVWLVGCLMYCCWRHHRRRNMGGAVPSGDVCFLSSPSDGPITGGVADSAHFSYSINSLAAEPAFHHTSLESILSEMDKTEGTTHT